MRPHFGHILHVKRGSKVHLLFDYIINLKKEPPMSNLCSFSRQVPSTPHHQIFCPNIIVLLAKPNWQKPQSYHQNLTSTKDK